MGIQLLVSNCLLYIVIDYWLRMPSLLQVNGNGHTFDGGGPFYWDGQGSNGGVEKPRPMMKCVNVLIFYNRKPFFHVQARIKISGTFENTKVVNSPAQTFSVSNPGPLTITGINIDNCLWPPFPEACANVYIT